jgi:hypothetical protein
MNNLLSYCGLTDAGLNASEKDIPVHVNDFGSFHFNDVLGEFRGIY